jgi:hypothetical protein
MRKAFLLALAATCLLSTVPASFAQDVNMDSPYGDRAPNGYQQLTTHYHNYWRAHHHPWSNIERERHIVREAQDFENLTKIYEGHQRSVYVHATDNTIRNRFAAYMWNSPQNDFNAELPTYFIEDFKNRPSMDGSTREALKLNEFLPKPLSYNDITYMPDEFTRKQLHVNTQRFRSGLVGNDLVLYDVVTGRVRGLWRDIVTN